MSDGLPRTRNELKQWCLRKLGEPVIEINLDEDQIEDRISEGLTYFRDYHFDGIEKVYYKHKVTATVLNFSAPVLIDFLENEIITGLTSESEVSFIDKSQDNLSIRVMGLGSATFVAGEIVQGQTSGVTATLTATNHVIMGDIDNKYIPIDDSVIGVIDVLPFSSSGRSSGSLFDIHYQFAMNSMHSLLSTDMITYTMFKQQMNLLQFTFNGVKRLRFNRKTDRCYIDMDWMNRNISFDEYIVLYAYKAVDPVAYTEVYADFFVREYCFALIKENWGEVLKKYSGIALPGGITLNGQQIYDEGVAYRKELEERIKREWQEPVEFLIG